MRGLSFPALGFGFGFTCFFILGKVGNGAHWVLKHHLDHVLQHHENVRGSSAVGHQLSPCFHLISIYFIVFFFVVFVLALLTP